MCIYCRGQKSLFSARATDGRSVNAAETTEETTPIIREKISGLSPNKTAAILVFMCWTRPEAPMSRIQLFQTETGECAEIGTPPSW